MGCQTTYSPTITIPTGLPGAPGTPGGVGTDGVEILVNTIATAVTSSSTELQTLVTSSLTAGSSSAGDILDFEAYCTLSAAFAGNISIMLGTQNLLSYTVTTNDVHLPAPGETVAILILKAKVLFKDCKYQSSVGLIFFGYTGEINFIEDNVTRIFFPLANSTQDSAAALAMKLDCTPSAGTVTCKYFTITHSKKV